MKTEKLGRNVLKVAFDDIRLGWEHWFLLTSDRHHDSRHTDLALAKEHLEAVKEKDGHVLDFGDFFDAMQGRYDPRRSYPDMQSRFLDAMQTDGVGYLDAIVGDAINFYGPYADRFLMISKGNHESAIATHNDVDLTNRLVYGLNSAAGTQIHTGLYGGWVRFLFEIQGSQRESVNLKYFHGAGGAAPVTKGTIQTNRQAVFLPDADIVVNGHIHEAWILPLKRERLSNGGKVYQDYQYHVRTGTYKDDYGDGGDGWAVEKGISPKPKGAVWLRFYYDHGHVKIKMIQELA